MRLLVLGGTAFVGRAVVEEAVARGWTVATFNRGRGAWAHPDVERITGDRLDAATSAPLIGREWDVVLDTWSGAPGATRDLAAVLAPRTERYAYISSCSVYAPPPVPGADETAPTVDGAGDDYAAVKRGSELAVEAAFGDRALLLRPGLILGPHEDPCRRHRALDRAAGLAAARGRLRRAARHRRREGARRRPRRAARRGDRARYLDVARRARTAPAAAAGPTAPGPRRGARERALARDAHDLTLGRTVSAAARALTGPVVARARPMPAAPSPTGPAR